MNRLVSIDHLPGTAVLKRTSEDEENDAKIERKSLSIGSHAHGQGKDQA